MKILHLFPTLNKGGAERIALDMCLELARQGYEVKVVALHPENQYEFLTQSLDYTVVKTRIELSLWRKNRTDVRALQAVIDTFQPDVIHSHLFEAEINSAFCRLPQHTKRVVHFHDNMVQMKRFSWRIFKSKRLLANFYERSLVLKNLPTKTHAIAISDDTFRYATQVIAALTLQDYKVDVFDTDEYDEFDSHQLLIKHTHVAHAEFLKILASTTINSHVTFSEASGGQVFTQSLALGVPCLTSLTHGYLNDSEELKQALVVERFDDAWAIAQKMEEVIANRDHLSKLGIVYSREMNQKADLYLKHF